MTFPGVDPQNVDIGGTLNSASQLDNKTEQVVPAGGEQLDGRVSPHTKISNKFAHIDFLIFLPLLFYRSVSSSLY